MLFPSGTVDAKLGLGLSDHDQNMLLLQWRKSGPMYFEFVVLLRDVLFRAASQLHKPQATE